MASKYAHLKGRVPERQPTARDAVMDAEIALHRNTAVAELTALYLHLRDDIATREKAIKADKAKQAARAVLIRSYLDQQNTDAVRVNNYTWSEGFEPLPTCDDIDAVYKYFHEHDMTDKLRLTASELAGRVETFVKEEAEANELIVVEVVDPATGESKTEVRSKIPGVKVFLKGSLSVVKSTQTKKEIV